MFREIDILIIGGGITGISLASFLKNRDYLLIEKENEFGGYCKSIKRNGFVWDYSGHFFHFRNEWIKNYLVENLDCELLEIEKKSHIYYDNKFIDYPFQNNIHQLNLNEFIECLHDLSKQKKEEYITFKDYILSSFGNGISEKFIIPYNQKLYCCDLNELDADAMGRFFPKKLNLESLLDNLNKSIKSQSYNDSFIYPVDGCYEFIKSLLKKTDSKKMLKGVELLDLDVENKIAITNKGKIKFKTLVNSTSFNFFYQKTTKKKFDFSYNKVAVFNLGFDSETEIKSNWIYFPGTEIFYRVGFYNNITKQNRMSLYVEISLEKNQIPEEKQLLAQVIKDLKKCNIVHNQKLVDYHFLIMSPAYVHISKESNSLYQEWSKSFNEKNIYSIGRYGSWTYCSMEDNILEAEKISKKI